MANRTASSARHHLRAYSLLMLGLIVSTLCDGASAANQWTEEDFYRKQKMSVPYVVIASREPQLARTVIGSSRYYPAHKGDTFLDLARFYGLGYNEIEQANPGVDPWIPPENQALTLPTEWVLPGTAYEGVVVNIPEMRLYYYHRKQGQGPLLVSTFPVGLGRDEWRTPKGKFRVNGKTTNPTWVIPESIREERIREKGLHDKFIAGGSPDNPLGKYRMELSLPSYRIHGTNIPWGVGMQVSHGCIRLYPEDIEQLFPMVPVGATGEFVYQPVKIGARDGRIFAEVHPDIYTLSPGMFTEARRIVHDLGWDALVDQARLQRAVEEQSGVPLDITLAAEEPELLEEDLRATDRRGAVNMPLPDRQPAGF